MEMSIEHIWTRFNRRWLFCGVFSSFTAGSLSIFLASILTFFYFGEWSYGLKLIGASAFGLNGTTFGSLGASGVAGLFIHLGLSLLYGTLFAQLVSENSSKSGLFILGVVTSFIIWVFGCQLFMPSFNPSLAMELPTRIGLLLHLFFGTSFGIALPFFRSVLLK